MAVIVAKFAYGTVVVLSWHVQKLKYNPMIWSLMDLMQLWIEIYMELVKELVHIFSP